jgi:hypothetical protein
MGCFEDLMEFRENVAKAETRRKGKARLPGAKAGRFRECKEEKMNLLALGAEVAIF